MGATGEQAARIAPASGGPAAPPPKLDDIREPDLPEVAAFIHCEVTGAPPTPEVHGASTARLHWLFKDNPARQDDVPWGWLVRDAEARIVGVMPCIPQRFAHQDKTFVALMSAKFYVSEAHRGAGVGIFMRYAQLNKRFALFCTTAAPQSVALWKKFGAYEIPDQDHEMIGTLRWGPVLEEAAFRRTRRRWLARAGAAPALLAPSGLRAARNASAGATLTPLSSSAQVMALSLPPSTDRLSALRDEAFMHWRHFTCPDPERHDVFSFRAPGGDPCLVITQLASRGHRLQIRALQVIDLWGPIAPAAMPALAGALANHYTGRFDMLVFRGQPPDRQQALRGAGFMRRTIETPVGWCIDRAGLLPTRDWYLVPADAE